MSGPPYSTHLPPSSRMSLRWRSYLWKEPHPVLPGELERLEADWGVRLPGEYKRLASLHQGMTPDLHAASKQESCMSETRHEEAPPVPAQPREASLSLLLRSPLALTVLCPLVFMASLLLLQSPGRVGGASWLSSRTWLLHALAALLPVIYVVSLLTALGNHRPVGADTPTHRRVVVFCTVLVVLLGILPSIVVLLEPPLVEEFPMDVDALTQMPGVRVKLPLLGILGAVVAVPHYANCFGIHIQLIRSRAEPHEVHGVLDTRDLDKAVLRYRQLRSRLRLSLGLIAANIGLNVLVLGAVHNLLLDALPSRQVSLDASFVMVCGVYLTGLLASVYLPVRHTLTAVGEALTDRLVQAPLGPHATWKQRTDERQAVRLYLGLRGSVLRELQDGLSVLTPLVASISSLLFGH